LGSADFPKDAVLAVMVREGGAINRLTHTPVGIAGAQMNSYRLFVLTL
jgi:hypothetical protein